MSKMVTLLAFVAVLLFCVASAHAQSLDATFEGMQDTAREQGIVRACGEDQMVTESILSISHTGCSMKVVKVDTANCCGKLEYYTETATFKLTDLDPAAVTVDYDAVVAHTTNDRKLVHVVSKNPERHIDDLSEVFWFKTNAYAQRFAAP